MVAQCPRFTQGVGLGRDPRLISAPDAAGRKRGAERDRDLPKVTQHCLWTCGPPVLQCCVRQTDRLASANCFPFPQGTNAMPSFLLASVQGCSQLVPGGVQSKCTPRLYPAASLPQCLSRPSVSQHSPPEVPWAWPSGLHFSFPFTEFLFTECNSIVL